MEEKTKVIIVPDRQPSAETRAKFAAEAQAIEDAVFAVVKEVIDRNDPETLLSCGAPGTNTTRSLAASLWVGL